MVHTSNPGTQRMEAWGLQVDWQPELHSKTLSPKTQNKTQQSNQQKILVQN